MCWRSKYEHTFLHEKKPYEIDGLILGLGPICASCEWRKRMSYMFSSLVFIWTDSRLAICSKSLTLTVTSLYNFFREYLSNLVYSTKACEISICIWWSWRKVQKRHFSYQLLVATNLTMLAADKLQLQSAFKQQATALKEKEFQLHHSNLSELISNE